MHSCVSPWIDGSTELRPGRCPLLLSFVSTAGGHRQSGCRGFFISAYLKNALMPTDRPPGPHTVAPALHSAADASRQILSFAPITLTRVYSIDYRIFLDYLLEYSHYVPAPRHPRSTTLGHGRTSVGAVRVEYLACSCVWFGRQLKNDNPALTRKSDWPSRRALKGAAGVDLFHSRI